MRLSPSISYVGIFAFELPTPDSWSSDQTTSSFPNRSADDDRAYISSRDSGADRRKVLRSSKYACKVVSNLNCPFKLCNRAPASHPVISLHEESSSSCRRLQPL